MNDTPLDSSKTTVATDLPSGFDKNVIRRTRKDGYSISCRLGLWEVFAADKVTAEREAIRYYLQYAEGGEYRATTERHYCDECGEYYFGDYCPYCEDESDEDE